MPQLPGFLELASQDRQHFLLLFTRNVLHGKLQHFSIFGYGLPLLIPHNLEVSHPSLYYAVYKLLPLCIKSSNAAIIVNTCMTCRLPNLNLKKTPRAWYCLRLGQKFGSATLSAATHTETSICQNTSHLQFVRPHSAGLPTLTNHGTITSKDQSSLFVLFVGLIQTIGVKPLQVHKWRLNGTSYDTL